MKQVAGRQRLHGGIGTPRTRRSHSRRMLLNGSALAGGVLAAALLAPRAALAAACVESPTNTWVCQGADGAESFTPTGTFQFNLGPDTGNPYLQSTSTDPAFSITSSAHDGQVHLFENSHIINTEDGVGLRIEADDGANVGVTVDGASGNGNVAGLISGGRGIYATGNTEDGSFTLTNNGHISGNSGAAVEVTGGLAVTINNFSLTSSIGSTDGDYLHGVTQVTYDNSGGVTAGLSGHGLDIVDVTGVAGNASALAIDITNGHGGVFAGSNSGISITDVLGTFGTDGTDVRIDNSGSATHAYAGGLIVGVGLDGIDVNSESGDHVHGNVTILNDFTRAGSIDLTKLDPAVFNQTESSGLLWNVLPGNGAAGGFTTGIWGSEAGINLNNIDQNATISNREGQIVGQFDQGVYFTAIAGTTTILNNGKAGAYGGGLIWGGFNGIEGFDTGSVAIDNDLGTIFGESEDGVSLDTISGDVTLTNRGGLTLGYNRNGITLSDVSGLSSIVNGAGTNGKTGLIIGYERAIDASGSAIDIANLAGGAILGMGSSAQPVMNLFTTPSVARTPGSSEGAAVYNDGLLSSYDIPEFNIQNEDFTADNLPAISFDYGQVFKDADNIKAYVGSGGAAGSIDSLDKYAAAAGLALVHSLSEGGGTAFINDSGGVMIGRFDMLANETVPTQANGGGGNSIVNLGTWLTTDGRSFVVDTLPADFTGTVMIGTGQNAVYNLGLVQTAFRGPAAEGGSVDETSTFLLNDFYNGRVPSSVHLAGGSGLLSMIDGAPGDVTDIFGDYHGANRSGFDALLGVDVNFATGRSDVLNVEAHAPPVGEVAATGGKIDGSTGIIVHVVGAAPTALNDTGITLVTGEDANPSSMQCFGRACKTGDTFFISPFSPSYIDVNGIGAVQDGMYAYYLTEVGDPHYALKSTFAPTAAQAPNLITGAQNIWYDSSGVVEDHIYGNHFPLAGAGGGGADLPESAGVAAPGEAAGNRSGLWARMSGGWDSRNTTVSDSVLGSVDTGFSQSTFEVLGGGDFSPSGIAGPFRFGVFGGYTTSSLDFSSFGASADYKGGVLGGYAAYTNGGYYADAQVTWDPLSLTYHMPFGDVSSNAKSLGVLANTGYRMQHGAYFVEPIASLAYVDTRLDDFSAGGASVDFSNGESLRAGAGGRVGTSFATWGGTMTEVSVLGKLWNEFESANKVTVTDGLGHSSTFTSGISGVFGELSASASIYTADRSVSGFVSGGAQFGADFTNWEAKAGIRKTF